jgi:RimJ/RimL family protein N-acetyltransferase
MSSDRDTFIRGEGINLRALRDNDLQGSWYGWFNDPEVTIFQNKGFYPNTMEKQEEFYRSLRADSTQVTLAIEATEGNLHIGNVTLRGINWVHRSAELGIVVGDKNYWGKKFGEQAWWLMTRYGFLTLNLNRIMAQMMKENSRSLRSALRSGYQVEGEMKQYYFKNGAYRDVLICGVTAERWRSCFGADPFLAFSGTKPPAA